MKKGFKYIVFAVLFGMLACNTDVENIGYTPEPPVFDDESIREYKKTDHELLFGWFGGWNGGSASMASSMKTIPDSVDMISNWGSWMNLTERQKEDLRYIQEVKGTKVLVCMFTPSVGQHLTPEDTTIEEFWGWDDNDVVKQEAAARKYADSLCRLVLSYGYDGMDWDNEVYNSHQINAWMIEEVGKHMGPKSGTDKIFCIDGYFWGNGSSGLSGDGILPEFYHYVDYFISQAYYENSYRRLDTRFNNYANFYKGIVDIDGTMTEEEIYRDMARKFIVTEDFEKYSSSGGENFTNRDETTNPSSLGHAKWQPQYNGMDLKKAGAGVYHMELDYGHSNGEYYWLNQMIQIMNPAGGNSTDE
ncbi:MAG: glycoside hydrolase family 18 [Rikenellaceae bacterium]|nr:glycoside hydrolase family 18 [Rikenellaceae bacterium]